MIKFAILKSAGETEDGKQKWFPVFEDGDVKRELTSRIRRILGPKKSYSRKEVLSALDGAFEDYKKDFKEQTIKLK